MNRWAGGPGGRSNKNRNGSFIRNGFSRVGIAFFVAVMDVIKEYRAAAINCISFYKSEIWLLSGISESFSGRSHY